MTFCAPTCTCDLQTDYLVSKLDPALEKELKRCGDQPPDLKRVILNGNMGMLIFTGVLYLFAQACSLAGPLLLQRIVKGLNCRAAAKKYPMAHIQCEEQSTLY